MEQSHQRYTDLARKWADGTITEEEKQEFSEWFNAEDRDPLSIPPSFSIGEEELGQRMFQQILARRQERAGIFPLWRRGWVQAAAAVLVVLSASFLLLYFLPSGDNEKVVVYQKLVVDNKRHQPTVFPGGNRAILRLADGSEIVLDSAQNGILASSTAANVIKLADGQLSVSANGKTVPATNNTLTTPRGGQYAITLADGTRVWINSASALSFPSAFSGPERKVELTGEAYFEVAKKVRQPFRVVVNGMDVTVLGTHFNIMAYADEEAVQTTLLEGAVQVRNEQGSSVLKPGQQALAKGAGAIRVREDIDTEQVLAWKNGLFQFEKIRIETIMRQLARWYGIDVVYSGTVREHFTGTISRQVGIEKVFRMLALTGAVQFSLSGNRVTVRPSGE
ncbi:FecR domain-containing protein [Flavisolibacter sp. BT320]|nr:FecR domain-containing protein [Flavisolibacter longurius]